VKFEPGHSLCVLSDSRFQASLGKLREKKLPPDKGPYADSDKGEVGRIAWLMKKEGRGDLESEARWLADILIPRIQMYVNEDGERADTLDIPDMRSHPDFEILFNNMPGAARESDEPMVPGRFLSQSRKPYQGVNYLLSLYTEELAALATSVMRASNREAYMSQIVGPGQDGKETVLFEGVSIFPDEQTMVHMPIDRTHPDVTGLLVQSDPAVLSTLHLRCAANKMHKEFPSLAMSLESGSIIDEKQIEERLKLVRKIAEQAKVNMPENPEIQLFMNAVNERRDALVSRMRELLAVSFGKGVLKYLADLEHEIRLKKGIARKKLFGYTEGVRPDEVERRVRFAVDSMVAGLKKYGPIEPITDALACVVQSVEGLVSFGLPDRSLRNLRSYIAEQEQIFEEPWVPEIELRDDNVPMHMCVQGARSKLVSLHKEIDDKKEKVPVEEIRKRVMEMADHIADGLQQFGRDCEPLVEVQGHAISFVKNVLPKYGYSAEFVEELGTNIERKMNEVSK